MGAPGKGDRPTETRPHGHPAGGDSVGWVVVFLASLLAIALGGPSIGVLSPTIDEWGYIQFGVKHWFGGSSQWLIDAGTQPLLFWVQGIPSAVYFQWKYGGLPGGPGINFGTDLPLVDQLTVLHLARWVNLLIAGPCTIWSLYLLTRRWFGGVAAAAAAGFCAVEPSLLASFILATADALMVPCALLAMVAYDDYLRERRVWKLLVVAVLFGLGLAIKILMLSNGLLVLMACFLIWLAGQLAAPATAADRLGLAARESARFLGVNVVVVLGVALLLSWALNGFLTGTLLNPNTENQVAYKVVHLLGYRGDTVRDKVAALQDLVVPGPVAVIERVAAHARGGHPMTFLGRSGYSGPWYYYPYILAMKTHLVLLGAVIIALLARGTWRSPIVWGTVLLLGFLCTAKVHGGPRYYLALLALLTALGGAGVAALLRVVRSRAMRVGIASVLAAGSLTLTAASMPDYLTHTSPLWGGDWAGYRYADANYDWGQGLYQAFAASDLAALQPISFIHSGDPHYGVPEGREVIPSGNMSGMLERMQGRYVAVAVYLLFHAFETEQAPLYRALVALGPAGRLNATFFCFDLRDPQKFATLEGLVEREKTIQAKLLPRPRHRAHLSTPHGS